jgi:hypothetical protein
MGVAAEPELLRTADEVTTYVVSTAVWAPSVHNTQPWQFAALGTEIDLRADASRQLTVADPRGREMLISCGAALFTAKLALRSLGYVPETRVLPDAGDPTLIARLRWRRRAAGTYPEEQLFRQVMRRRTHRGGFEPAPVPAGLVDHLRRNAAWHDAALRVAVTDEARAVLAAITQTADEVERLDRRFAGELAAWSPPPASGRLDGVPASAYTARPERTTPFFPGRDFGRGHGWGLPFSTRIAAARYTGLVCLLTTPADDRAAWVDAGQALQHILLTATECGVAAALHSQPVEVSWLREAIRQHVGDGSYPQLVLRLGTVLQSEVSVRRPSSSVLTTWHRDPRSAPPGGIIPVAASGSLVAA